MCPRDAYGQIAAVCFTATIPATCTIEPASVLVLPAVTHALDNTSRLMLPSHGMAFAEVRSH
jgi:hypothetical protein